MTTPIRVSREFKSNMREPRHSASKASNRRESIIGFMVGLTGILTFVCGVVVFHTSDPGMIWGNVTALVGR